MTIEEIKLLKHGDILHHVSIKNRSGEPYRVRVNGKLKTWKTRPSEFKLPVKHGLYEYGYITEQNINDWNK